MSNIWWKIIMDKMYFRKMFVAPRIIYLHHFNIYNGLTDSVTHFSVVMCFANRIVNKF